MSKIKIHDESGDRNYFTQIPNYIANHSTANDQSLYFQMKRYAGEDGKCFATQETIMKKMGIGRKAYTKSLKYLLDKKWIRFVGMTGGKTRSIKTYAIVDIWKLNVMEYEKIPSERTVSIGEDTVQKEKDTDQKHSKIPSESTIEEEPVLRRTIEEDNTGEHSSQEINLLLKSFENTNPAIKQMYGNKTQRKACRFLIDTYGLERVQSVAEKTLLKTNKVAYFPTITTPLQLQEKWASLESAVMKYKDKLQTEHNKKGGYIA